jgi:hypothetical protein
MVRPVNAVSNPSSDGIEPVKALLAKVETIVQASQCIFVAEANKVE